MLADASLISAKLINLTVKKYFTSYSIKYSSHWTRYAMYT